MFVKLQYFSPALYVAEEMIEFMPDWQTQDLISQIAITIKLKKEHFRVTQKKDGQDKRIIDGWSLSHYDFDSMDIIQLLITVPQQQFEEDDQYKGFIFKMSYASQDMSADLSEMQDDEATTSKAQNYQSQVYENICDLIASIKQESLTEELIQDQINKGNDLLNKLNSDGWGIIHHMAYYECQRWFQYIRDEKFTININLETTDGWTPLQIAVRQKDISGINQYIFLKIGIKTLMLFDQIKINQLTSKGSALHIACKIGDQNIIRLLFDQNADPFQKDYNQQNCYCVSNQKTQNYLVFLQNGATIDPKLSQFSQIKGVISKGSVMTPGNFIWQLKERYLILNPMTGTLQRCCRLNLQSPREIIDICQISQIINEFTQRGLSENYFFTKVLHGKKSMIFGTQYKDQADRWVTMIRQAMVYQKNILSNLQKVNQFIEPDEVDLDIREMQRLRSTENSSSVYEINITSNLAPPLEEINVPIRQTTQVSSFNKYADFKVVRVLGQGSFGVVFLASHKQSGLVYALKVMNKVRLIKKRQIKYAVTEAKILSQVNHPFVIKMFYAFQTPQNLYMALEYCSGSDLYVSLTKLGRFNEDVARYFICEIILALEYLHSKDIVYRDLKPENVLLCEDGHIKLTDFGLSKQGVAYEINSKSFCGSPAYMGPETLLRTKTGKYVDYYALGIVLYELLTGTPPFVANQLEIIYQLIKAGQLKFPAYISPEARDLIKLLTNRDVLKRIDFAETKKHAFFQSIDWNKVISKYYKPPIKIRTSENDLSSVSVTFDDLDYVEDNFKLNKIIEFDYTC